MDKIEFKCDECGHEVEYTAEAKPLVIEYLQKKIADMESEVQKYKQWLEEIEDNKQ